MAKHKYIETPERLWQLFEAYVAHEQLSPMYKTEYVGKDGNMVRTALETPITFEGFECYLADEGVVVNLSGYEANKDGSYDEYLPIITRIKQNCFVHNFKGASVGLFNPNLIARKLGLTEKRENHNTEVIQVLNIDPLDDSADNSTT
jgi:hypothetical protein